MRGRAYVASWLPHQTQGCLPSGRNWHHFDDHSSINGVGRALGASCRLVRDAQNRFVIGSKLYDVFDYPPQRICGCPRAHRRSLARRRDDLFGHGGRRRHHRLQRRPERRSVSGEQLHVRAEPDRERQLPERQLPRSQRQRDHHDDAGERARALHTRGAQLQPARQGTGNTLPSLAATARSCRTGPTRSITTCTTRCLPPPSSRT